MTSLADVMANLQDSERTLATVRQWASERVSDCHDAPVWLDEDCRALRCVECGRECEPVLPDEKETIVADDNREERPDLDRLRRQAMSLPEAAAAARYVERLEAAIEFPPSRPSPQAMEMACQRALRTERDRAEKVEAAARDLARWLHEIARRPSVERNPDGEDQAANSMKLIAREALARYPEYAPKGKEAP